ncbi:MAG: hypothetical protein JSR77_01855 [Planctomycetes bacterium]|nr:hypothetical protein [Planctomycetota bacterium]
MYIPIGSRFTSVVSGGVIKPVQCAHCDGCFLYRMQRTARGHGRSFLWLDNDGASSRAAAKAHRKLYKTLETDFDVVACPGCGNYQPAMVKKLRVRAMCWSLVVFAIFKLLFMFPASPASPLASPVSSFGQFLNFIDIACITACLVLPWLWNPNAKAEHRIEAANANPQILTEEQVEELLADETDAPERAASGGPTRVNQHSGGENSAYF